MACARRIVRLVVLAGVLVSVAGLVAPAEPVAAEDDLAPKLRGALVKVYVTSQSWDSTSPWKKSRPSDRAQRGVVVRPGLVLTPAAALSDHLMVEVSVANSARRYPASLAHVDHDGGLALVKVEDEALRKTLAPLPIGDPVTIDDEFEIWQLGASELLERSTARVLKVEASWVQLNLTIKTTLSDDGDGQVALRDGKVVGLVTGTTARRQEGTILSLATIRHYLDDTDGDAYRGFGHGGIWWHELLRDDLRAHYDVPEGVSGIVVSHLVPGRSGHGVLEVGDVITHLNGRPVDDEGMYDHPRHGRLSVIHALVGETHPGDEVAARVRRAGKNVEVKIPIRAWPASAQLVPRGYVDRRPLYMVVGGMVILELTRSSRVRDNKLQEYQSRAWWDPPGERSRILYASRVLADPANKGLDELIDEGLKTVNGQPIGNFRDVAKALETPRDGFHVFAFEGEGKDFVIRADELAAIDARIMERWGVTELRYLGE